MPSAAAASTKAGTFVEEGAGIGGLPRRRSAARKISGIRFGQTEFVRQHVALKRFEQRKLRPQEMPLHLVGVGDQRDLGATEKSLDHRQDLLGDAEVAGPDLKEGLRIHYCGRTRGLAYRVPKLSPARIPRLQGSQRASRRSRITSGGAPPYSDRRRKSTSSVVKARTLPRSRRQLRFPACQSGVVPPEGTEHSRSVLAAALAGAQGDRVALFATDECARQRGRDGEASLFDVAP